MRHNTNYKAFICLIFVLVFGLFTAKDQYGSYNNNWENTGNTFHENTIKKDNNYPNAYTYNPDYEDSYNKAGGPPIPPEDAPIDKHLIIIFIIAIVTSALFAKKYTRLIVNKS